MLLIPSGLAVQNLYNSTNLWSLLEMTGIPASQDALNWWGIPSCKECEYSEGGSLLRKLRCTK